MLPFFQSPYLVRGRVRGRARARGRGRARVRVRARVRARARVRVGPCLREEVMLDLQVEPV